MSKSDFTELSPETLMLAYLCIKDEEGLNRRVELLDRFGLNDSQIAQVCGAVVQSIRNARSRYKKTTQSGSAKEGSN